MKVTVTPTPQMLFEYENRVTGFHKLMDNEDIMFDEHEYDLTHFVHVGDTYRPNNFQTYKRIK